MFELGIFTVAKPETRGVLQPQIGMKVEGKSTVLK
jgi:hypothetical protein